MTNFTKLFCTAFLLLAGCFSANAQEEEKVYATFESPSGITWDAENMTFSWESQWGNQLHNIGLPTGNLAEYSKLVVDCEILEGDGYRFMFYATDKGTTAGGQTIITESGKKEYNLADFDMDQSYLTNCSEICLSGYNASGKVKVNEVYLVKSQDPLASYKKLLSDAITIGKMQSSFAKTASSWSALQSAISDGETALAASDATESSLTGAKTAIEEAVAGLTLEDGYSELTGDMFKQYASVDEPGDGTDLGCNPVLFKASDLPYGDGNVSELKWADLTNYQTLVVTTAGTVKPRFCLNRLVNEGQQAATMEDSKMLDINPNNEFTWSTEKYLTAEDGVYTLNLAAIVEDYGFARLHCIKKQGWGDGVIVTGMYLTEAAAAAEPVDIEISPAEGDIAAALEAAKAGKNVRNITINLKQGITYTLTQPIKAFGAFEINGNGATIDASGLESGNAMFVRDGEEDPAEWVVSSFSMKDVNVNDLSKAVFYSAVKNNIYTGFTIDNCVIELAADVTAFDFTKGSAARVFTITNSTIYALTATEKSLYSSQSGQKATEYDGDVDGDGEPTQTFVIKNNTMYNLTKAKNFFSHRQSNQTWIIYDVENNIFVNCGKKGQTIKGINGGQGGKNPVWTITGNAFNFDDADTSANEETGDSDEPVENSVAGVVTFTDAASGNFNATFAVEGTAPESLGDPRWTITFKEAPKPLLTLKGTVGEEVSLTFGVYDTEDTFTVDFGDGNPQEAKVGINNAGPKQEDDSTGPATVFKGTVAGDGTITVSGNNDIWYLVASGAIPSSFDQPKLMNVVQMSITGANVESVALPAYEKMTQFSFNNSPVKTVDVSKVAGLTSLTINSTAQSAFEPQIESIDVSKNTELDYLSIQGADGKQGKLASADLSKNIKLTGIYLQYNKLSQVTLPAEYTALNNSGAIKKITLSLNNNELTELKDLDKVPEKSLVYIQNNKFTLATLPTKTANVKTYNYAPQAAYEVAETLTELDLSSQLTATGVLSEPATTTYTFVTASSATLVEGTDYTVTEPGKFTFIKAQGEEKIHGVMATTAFPNFKDNNAYVTTEFTIDPTAVGIKNIQTADAAAKVFNLQGVEVSQPQKGIYVKNGKKVVIK
ncbi:MAG: DUF5123 domain-containing protein [Prevotella sp.]|nr:DUF5123 domain-containing protein [Prevotella sp.]